MRLNFENERMVGVYPRERLEWDLLAMEWDLAWIVLDMNILRNTCLGWRKDVHIAKVLPTHATMDSQGGSVGVSIFKLTLVNDVFFLSLIWLHIWTPSFL